MTFRTDGLRTARDAVTRYAVGAGLPDPRVTDLVLAVNEVAANSIRQGGDGAFSGCGGTRACSSARYTTRATSTSRSSAGNARR